MLGILYNVGTDVLSPIRQPFFARYNTIYTNFRQLFNVHACLLKRTA